MQTLIVYGVLEINVLNIKEFSWIFNSTKLKKPNQNQMWEIMHRQAIYYSNNNLPLP